MKIIFTKYFILFSFIKFTISDTNKTMINIENIITDRDIKMPENITISNNSKTPLDAPIININTINKTSETPKKANVTL